jgi:streptogramin lyase
MIRRHIATIRSLVLAAAGILAFSIQTAATGPKPCTGFCDSGKSKPVGLYVGGFNFVYEFQGKALEKSGTPTPNLAFGGTTLFNPLSITFDSHENLWIAYGGTSSGPLPVIELTRANLAALKKGKGVNPKVVIKDKGKSDVPFILPRSLAFDSAGDLWVSDPGRNAIMDFLPKQIKKSGGPSPTTFISAADFVPEAIRFDASDNLWVSAGNSLWRFAPGDRDASGAPNPSLVVDLPAAFGVQDLAFDGSGNLWIAGADFTVGILDEVKMIAAGDLVGTGEISPPVGVTITSSAFGTEPGLAGGICLGGIDFDQSGNLWVSAHCDPDTHLIEFTPSQLSTGGNLVPSVTIGQNHKQTNLLMPGPIRFGATLK